MAQRPPQQQSECLYAKLSGVFFNVEITDLEIAKSLLNLIQKIEEDEDVTEVFANFTIAKEIEEMLGE